MYTIVNILKDVKMIDRKKGGSGRKIMRETDYEKCYCDNLELVKSCDVHRKYQLQSISIYSSVIRFTLSVYIFSIPVAATVDLMVSRIGPIWLINNSHCDWTLTLFKTQ